MLTEHQLVKVASSMQTSTPERENGTVRFTMRNQQPISARSEERRVGKECHSTLRYEWWSSLSQTKH